jgi:hypothetical protein
MLALDLLSVDLKQLALADLPLNSLLEFRQVSWEGRQDKHLGFH